MRILLTVVTGYLDYERTILHSKVSSEILVHEDTLKKLSTVIADRVEVIRTSWPEGFKGYQNVISVSHSILP